MSSTAAPPKTNIMSNEQVANVRHGALPWLYSKTQQKSLQFLQAVKFELVTDKECWLRGGGKITVRMLIEFEQQSYEGPPQGIKVYSSKNAFYDLEAITAQLADILAGYLQGKGHIARIHFTGKTKEAMMKTWQQSAISWLILDIGDDPDILEYLNYSTNDGSKLIVGSAFGQELAKLDIIFNEGRCQFNTLALELSKKADEHYGVTLTSDQIERSEKAIGSPLVKIIRDQSYSHPYSSDTKKKLLDMAKYIKKVKGQFPDISTLALAGSVADALDDNLEGNLSQAYDLADKSTLDYIRRHQTDISDLGSHLLSAALSSWHPGVQLLAGGGIIAWDLILRRDQRKKIIMYGAELYSNITRIVNQPVATVIAPLRDEQHDYSVELEVKSGIDHKTLSKLDTASLKKDIRSLILKTTTPSQVLCNFAFGESRYSGKILQNAREINRMLADHNKKSQDRNSVTKWERFYHDFK
ncbi:MAG: hypothetical protein KJ720_11030 [Proteobacteria bacterium]|nr:hypothetical protein [Pseudomonadota bacterium]MBU1449489.1 hypothetical protein [Pseudomonadota bacterium]MBU2470680.1 hypothetical protein [Pseudomonadota bacterium]MBU2517263.1 hypothetical protein [Pseudomonadota bacterium]